MDLVLFGIQGSGKGTQAKRLSEEKGYVIFEAGGELRKIAASGTPLGEQVASFIDQGHLVPFEIIMEVVRGFVEDLNGDGKQILFDGIPRDMDQMQAFVAMMDALMREYLCVHITINEEDAVQRILGRAREQGRADDADEDIIRRRMALFHEKTEPVIKAFEAEGKVVEVDGEGGMEEVFERILLAIE